ncbi:hypothetical protein BUALT_Bualt05G0105700 [Buddleja alternifolia]|uniref:Uncharacterized protein n=1 Tax=Buddleja alternifolia TaxID=168488 RepID=A0AAV6XUN7_9LAMI|nr:hypothetical protein BUALT_Bualt05G0105700 [Buddleja alternifolia]
MGNKISQDSIKSSHQKTNINNNNNNNDVEDGYKGVGIHSQVRKIKQEMEKINRPALQQPETRPALREIMRHHQRSRSPLGLAERPISV